MRTRRLPLVMAACLALVISLTRDADAQAPVALTGVVTSGAAGAMEGVLVSARQAGSTITITVVSDQHGRYRFPAAKLAPGRHELTVRAAGFELSRPAAVDVATPKTTTADLELVKTADLSTQLTNAEWLSSMPGPQAMKSALLGCVQCHSLERIVKSPHDAAAFMQVMQRMGTYTNQSTPLHVQARRAERLLEVRGEERDRARRALAEFLASVNLGGGSTWKYPLTTLPRPTGRGTRAIVTEYALPRATIQPHDVIVDPDGVAWFCNFGEQTLGKLDPKTGKVTEFAVPALKPGFPTGALSVRFDRDHNLWLGMMFQGGVAKFDRKTETFTTWSLPAEHNRDMTQVNMTSPSSSFVDGKVWTNNNGFAAVHRLDLATGRFETWEPFRDGVAKGRNHNIYDVIADSKNNAWFTDFANEHVGRIDARTGALSLFTIPTARSAPRRAQMDAQDRLWFAEYRGNKIGMFDTRTERFREWEAPTPWSQPYDVTLDRNGDAWTGSMLNDRVLRLDTRTGGFTEYLLPRPTNIRRVFVDDSRTPPTFWVGNNHGASVIKLEPLD